MSNNIIPLLSIHSIFLWGDIFCPAEHIRRQSKISKKEQRCYFDYKLKIPPPGVNANSWAMLCKLGIDFDCTIGLRK